MIDYRNPKQSVNKRQEAAASQDASVLHSRQETFSQEASSVLRNTYLLLSATLLFSAFTATVSMAFNFPYLGLWMLLPYFFLLWMVEKNKAKTAGIGWVFALTGWMGLSLGPILKYYISAKGYETVTMALGGTGLIFLGSSAYILTTRKNLSFLTGFLITGILVAFIASIANAFMQIQGLSLAISSVMIFIASGFIMWQTSQIIHGGERNYISATVTLFVMLYNIFSSLLHLLGLSND